jgi:PKD repeat protein
MREGVLETYRALRRRHAWVRGLDLFLEIAFVMTLTVAAMLLIDRLAFELGWSAPHLARYTLPLMGGTLAVAAVLAVAILQVRKASPAQLAWLADRSVGGETRFLSALEIAASGDGGGFAPLVLREAAELPVEPKRVLPRPPVGYRIAIVLALAAAGVLHAFPPQQYPAPHAGFRATPERGAAPLEVSFESLHQGYVDEIVWDFGDGGRGSGADAAHLYEKPGTFRVIQEVRGPGGAVRHERTVEVLPEDHPIARFEAEPSRGRAPLAVQFRNLSQNAERYEWDFGDGTTSPDAEPRHVFAKPDTYAVKLKAIGPKGSDAATGEVKVFGEDRPLADFRALPRKGPAPLRVLFEDLSSGKIDSWEWDFGDLYAGNERFSAEPNPTHQFRFPGKYTVTLRVKGPGGEDVEEKIAYIVVEADGGGGGGGKSGEPKKQTGGKPGTLFGKKTPERKIGIDPSIVTAEPKNGAKTPRDRTVYSRGDGGAEERKVAEVFPRYERAAEETMGRERIPPAVRDYVKKYFEDIRPK